MPVVVQDHRSLRVLTLAYVNEEDLKRTLETVYAHYFRRSFGKVMMKGETSGNVQGDLLPQQTSGSRGS